MVTRKKPEPAKAKPKGSRTAFLAVRSPAPTEPAVRDELILFWDGFSPLNPAAIRMAYDLNKALKDIAVSEDDALTFINKYNSLVLRGPGRGPLVATGEVRAWYGGAMKKIVQAVAARAQP